MMSIAFKEGVKIDPHALQEIILACNNDIRQVTNNYSYFIINYVCILQGAEGICLARHSH